MNRLKNAIEGLAAAALEFEEACHEVYRHKSRAPRKPGAQFTAESAMYDLMGRMVDSSIYSRVQWRAIQGDWSAWRPKLNKSAQSLPWGGRSGGAA